MRIAKAYKLSLMLPLLIPALLYPLLISHASVPEWLGTIVLYTVMSGFVGGIPYVILVVLLLWWMRGKTDPQIRLALLLSPLLMLPIFCLYVAVVMLIRFGASSAFFEFRQASISYSPFVLVFGYTYVILVFTAMFVFRRLGAVSPSDAI